MRVQFNRAVQRCLPHDDEATHGDSDAEDDDLTSSSSASQFSVAAPAAASSGVQRPPCVQSLLTALISARESSSASLQRCIPVVQPAKVPQHTAAAEQLDMLPTPRLFHEEAAARSPPPSLFGLKLPSPESIFARIQQPSVAPPIALGGIGRYTCDGARSPRDTFWRHAEEAIAYVSAAIVLCNQCTAVLL